MADGYEEEFKTQCINCNEYFDEEELAEVNIGIGDSFKACPNCREDGYLMDTM